MDCSASRISTVIHKAGTQALRTRNVDGILCQRLIAQTDCYQWCISGLNRQRAALSGLDETATPDIEEVLVPTIVSLYEVFTSTTPVSVFQHLAAAVKILEMRGPHNYITGVAHQLFNAMRVANVSILLLESRVCLKADGYRRRSL